MINKVTLIKEIRDAFNHVELDDGVGLWEAQALDDYVDAKTLLEIRKGDEKKCWRNICYGEIAKSESSLTFFDAKGMTFHLPIYLIFYLLEDEIFPIEGFSAPNIVFTLSNDLEGNYQSERFSLLNNVQVRCVIRFLKYRLQELKKEQKRYADTLDSDIDIVDVDYECITINRALLFWKKKLSKYQL